MSWVATAIAGTGVLGAYLGNKNAKGQQQAVANATTAQGENNLDVAKLQSLLNNPNTVTPFGSSQYTMGEDGRPVLTQTLSPAEQEKLNKSNKLGTGALDILQGNLPNIQAALSGPFGMQGAAKTDYDPRYAPTRGTPTDLSFAGAPGMPSADARVLQQVEDAMYGQGAQYLDPQYKQIENEMRVRLANQGIVPGTEAYNTEMENFGLRKQKAYGDLTQSSILGGQSAMSNLYDLAIRGRQQGVGEATTQGEFTQKGVGQQAQIASNQATLANAGRGQNYNEYTTNRTMPLNMFNSLMTQGQVNAPTFQPTQPTSIQPAPLLAGATTGAQIGAANASANAGLWGQGVNALTRLITPTSPVAPSAQWGYNNPFAGP
jgi:hypothetical protein